MSFGIWLGVLFAPTMVPTLRSMWRRPGPTPGTTVPAFGTAGTLGIRLGGLALLGIGFIVLWTIGMAYWG